MNHNLFALPFIQDMTDSQASVHGKVMAMTLEKGVVASIYCREEFDYAEGIANLWNSKCRNLFIIEHDIIPTVGTIEEMEFCPYLLCVPLYTTGGIHTGLANPVIPHRKFDSGGKLQFISANEPWVDRAGFGCIKIHKLVRQIIYTEAFDFCPWGKLDSLLSRLINEETGLQFHVHNIWVEHDQS
jgi:hypothetical protein